MMRALRDKRKKSMRLAKKKALRPVNFRELLYTRADFSHIVDYYKRLLV